MDVRFWVEIFTQEEPIHRLSDAWLRRSAVVAPSCTVTIGIPIKHCFPMVFLWFSNGFPMVFQWSSPFSNGFPMVFQWQSPFSNGTHHFPMVITIYDWLVVSNMNFLLSIIIMWDVIRDPLTNSIIFQDG